MFFAFVVFIFQYIYLFVFVQGGFLALELFMALCCRVTGAPPTVSQIQILPMNEHA
jgi:hypothetical protein